MFGHVFGEHSGGADGPGEGEGALHGGAFAGETVALSASRLFRGVA